MVTFPELIRPTTLLNFIDARSGRTTGLQGAHLIGDKFWARRDLGFLGRLGYGIAVEASSNGSLAPETARGGYVLGVSVHDGQQLDAFDQLQFDVDDRNSPKFMNAISRALINAERDFAVDGDVERFETE